MKTGNEVVVEKLKSCRRGPRKTSTHEHISYYITTMFLKVHTKIKERQLAVPRERCVPRMAMLPLTSLL